MIRDLFLRAKPLASAALAAAALIYAQQAGAQKLDSAFSEQAAADKAAAASQARVDQLQEQAQDAASQYRRVLTETESLKKYNEQLAAQVKSQATRLAEVKKEIDGIDTTQRDVLPLMQKMVDTLEKFVKLDVPFLLEERTRRVAGLKDLLPRSDITTSEKYRRILEAYQIEMEYGRTVDATEGTLGEGGSQKTVTFVRVGRVTLLYQTPDGKETGYWDTAQKKWVEDNDYSHDVREALRVAKKVGAPALLMVPVPAAKEVKS